MSTEISESYNNMTVDGLRLNKYLKVYESISKNPTYTKETSLVASSIKFMIREMIKKYGDVIDPNIKYFRY